MFKKLIFLALSALSLLITPAILAKTVRLNANPTFVIPQILAGADYAKIITVTVKDKKFVNKALTANTIRMDIKSDVGTTGGDFTTFYTNNGTKTTGNLPKTAPPSIWS